MRKTSGISLMVLIFLSLCLITFSLLSLSGATADETLSQKAADRTAEYYAAVSEANRILAEIDETLAGYLKEANAKEASYMNACSAIADDLPEVTWTDGTLTFSVPINDDQLLHAALDVTYPKEDSDTLYKIAAWETVNTREWNADTSMHLFRLESE